MPRIRRKPAKRRPRRLNPKPKQLQNQPPIHTTDEQVIEAIMLTKGNLAAACRKLKLRSPGRLRQRINKSAKLKQALLDAREELLGLAETALEAGVINGEWQPIKHVLDNFGAPAGYRRSDEKVAVNINQPQNITVEVGWGEGPQGESEAPEDEG